MASTLATCLIGVGKLDEATNLLTQINVPAVTQLAGDPNWGAGVTLLQAEIAYRRKDYEAARKYVQTVTPIFEAKDAEPYEKHALENLSAELNKISQRN